MALPPGTRPRAPQGSRTARGPSGGGQASARPLRRSRATPRLRVPFLLLLGAAAVAVTIWAVPDGRFVVESWVAARFAGPKRRMDPLAEYVRPATVKAAAPAVFLPDSARPPAPREIANGLDILEDLVFTPDGRCLLTAGYGDFSVRLWDVEAGAEVQGLRTHCRPSSLLVHSARGVLVADVYGFLRAYPVHSSARLGWARLTALEGRLGSDVAMSPDGRLLATPIVGSYAAGGESSDLVLLRSADLSVLRQLKLPEALRRPAFSATGRLLAVGSTANTFTVWDLATGEAWLQMVPRVGARSDVASVAFSPDERLLATGHMDSSITIWDVASRRERQNFFVDQSSTWKVAFSPAGDVLATAQQDGTIRLWDPETAKPRATLRGHTKNVREIAFAPDGRRLASYGEDGRILVWESGGDAAVTAKAAAPDPSVAPSASLTSADVLRLFAKIDALPAIPDEQRQRLRQAFDRLPAMQEEERAAFVASLLLLASADELARGLGQVLGAGGGAFQASPQDAELLRWNLEQLPEAAPLVAGIEAVRSGDAARLPAVFARSAVATLEQRGWESVASGLKRLWGEALGGSGPSELHVSFLGTKERGVLHVAHPTHGLPRAGVSGSVDMLEVPVVFEEAAWKIADPPTLPEP